MVSYMKILFISSGQLQDYMNDMVFHGLKLKFGLNVYESNDLWFMYNNITTEQKRRLYGKGFTLYGKLDVKFKNVEDKKNLLGKIKSKYYDLIIYGSIQREKSYLRNVLKIYPKNRVIFIDGEDNTKVIKRLTWQGLYFKRELIDKHVGNKVFPINFSIPSNIILDKMPAKRKEWATIIPGNKNSYVYDNDKDYYLDYQVSKYGTTIKKAGWDCLRHYEILANGCIPYFPDLENCPTKTLTKFPKQIILETNQLIEEKRFTDKKYETYINSLLDWTREKLTTDKLVNYILSKVLSPDIHNYPPFDYFVYLRQLYRRFGLRALIKQFHFHRRRPFSRGLINKYAPEGFGLEIGVGFFTIAPLKRTILTDGFETHGSDDSIATDYCKADDIMAPDESFEFVLSEHVLEHLGNPVKAIKEWKRILKPKGKIFLFLPHKDRTFDRNRQRTELTHLFDDYSKHILDIDNTHLGDWISNVISPGLAPQYASIPIEKHPELGLIHHHVWTDEDICELLRALDIKIIYRLDRCPDRQDSFVIVAEKN